MLRSILKSCCLALLMVAAPSSTPARGADTVYTLVGRWPILEPPRHMIVEFGGELGGVGVAVNGDDVLVVNKSPSVISILGPATDLRGEVPLGSLAVLGAPDDVAGLADGSIIVSFGEGSRVVQVDRQGDLVCEWQVRSPRGLVHHLSSTFVVSEDDHAIVELTACGAIGKMIPLPASVLDPFSVDVRPSTDWTRPEAFTLVVVDRAAGLALAVDALTGESSELFRLPGLRCLAVWGDATVVGVDGQGLMVRDSSGGLSTALRTESVNDIAMDGQGAVFATLTSGKVLALPRATELQDPVGTLHNPWAVAADDVPIVIDEQHVHIWNRRGEVTGRASLGGLALTDVGAIGNWPYKCAPGDGVYRANRPGGDPVYRAEDKSGLWPILVAGTGNGLFISDIGRQEIIRYAPPDGPETDRWSFLESGAFVDLRDIAANGEEVVALTTDGRARFWSASGTNRGELAVSPDGVRVALASDGSVFVLDWLGWIHHIGRGGTVLERFSASLGATVPIDLAFDSSGRLLVVDPAGEVRVYEERPSLGVGTPSTYSIDPCAVRADKNASPSRLPFGDTVQVELAVVGPCGGSDLSDLVLVLDGGLSGHEDVTTLKDVALRVVAATSMVRGARVGVVISGNSKGGRVLSELTPDAPQVAHQILTDYPRFREDSLTGDLLVGLRLADELLRDSPAKEASPAIVILTFAPGERTAAHTAAIEQLAAELRSRGVRIAPVELWTPGPYPWYHALSGSNAPGLHMGPPWEVHRLSGEIQARLHEADVEPWRRLVIEDQIAANMEYVPGSAEPSALYDASGHQLVWRFEAPIERGTRIRYELRPKEVGVWPTNRRAWAEYEGTAANDTVEFPVPWVEVVERVVPTATPSATASPTASLTPEDTVTLTPTATGTSAVVPTASSSPTFTTEPTPTLTFTPTPSARPSPRPVFLPIGILESCPPKDLYVDVALVIDASTSMLDTTVVGRTKLDLAVESVGLFLNRLRLEPGRDRAAIVVFNDDAQTLQWLTRDRSSLDSALRRIRTSEHSRLDLGVERAMVELLARGDTAHLQAMVVLSDGKANPVPGSEAVAAAKRAQRAGITIYIVGLGPSMDERVLREMASGADRYVAAQDPATIPRIYSDLTRRVACPPQLYWGGR